VSSMRAGPQREAPVQLIASTFDRSLLLIARTIDRATIDRRQLIAFLQLIAHTIDRNLKMLANTVNLQKSNKFSINLGNLTRSNSEILPTGMPVYCSIVSKSVFFYEGSDTFKRLDSAGLLATAGLLESAGLLE
jgi:hypothetical protein